MKNGCKNRNNKVKENDFSFSFLFKICLSYDSIKIVKFMLN